MDRRGPHPRYIDPTCQPQEEDWRGELGSHLPLSPLKLGHASTSPPPTDLERSGALEDSGRRGFAAQGRGRSRGGPGGAGWRRRRELGGGAVGSSGAEPGGPGWVMFFVVLVISVTDELKFSYF
jgi:hypothetical protein